MSVSQNKWNNIRKLMVNVQRWTFFHYSLPQSWTSAKKKIKLFWELSILKVIKYVFLHAWNSSFWMELHLKGMHLESKIWFLKSINTHTMMLLMGMWINRTKNPINPMMANPIAVAIAIFWNSNLEKRKNWLGYILSYFLNKLSTYDKY